MTTKTSLAFLLTTACLAVTTPSQDTPRKITIKPKVGEAIPYRSTLTQHQTIETMGQDSTNEIITDLQVKVDEVASDGTVKATATWLRIRGKVQVMGSEIEFDTKKPDDATENSMLDGLVEGCVAVIGSKTALTFGADGKLLDKKPLEGLAGKMVEKIPGFGKMILQGILSPHMLEDQASVFGSYSAEPVAVGGSWTEKRDMKGRGGLGMTSEITRKLDVVSDDVYGIKLAGTLTSATAKKDDKGQDDDDDDQTAMMRNMMGQAQIKDGKIEGEQKVARKDGLLIASQTTTSMAMHMPNPMGGDEPFVVIVKQTHKLERVVAEAAKEAASPKK